MNAQPRHAASGRETSCSASSRSLSTTTATTAEKWKSVCHRHSPSHVSHRLPVHVPYGLSTWRKVQLVPAVINQASGGDCAVSVVTQCSDFNSGLCHRLERLYRNQQRGCFNGHARSNLAARDVHGSRCTSRCQL